MFVCSPEFIARRRREALQDAERRFKKELIDGRILRGAPFAQRPKRT